MYPSNETSESPDMHARYLHLNSLKFEGATERNHCMIMSITSAQEPQASDINCP